MSTKKKSVIIILAVLLLAVAGVLMWLYYHPKDDGGSAYVDPNAGEWDDGLPSDGSIKGSIQIPGYSTAQMTEGDTTLALRIGNPNENTCYLKATLTLEDGTPLFESGLIEPGKGFESVPLDTTLSAGTYTAIVHYQGYTMDDEKKPLNSADSAFTLTVIP